MTSRALRPFWPLPPWLFVMSTVAVCVVALYGTWSMLLWPYQEWARTSAQFHQQTALAGPIAAAAAAYLAGRLCQPSRIFATPIALRAGWPTASRHLVSLWTILIGGYVAGLAPVVALTVDRAEYGGPDILAITSGLCAMAASISVGYLLGVVIRATAVAPPTALLLVFAVTVIGAGGGARTASVVPVTYAEPSLGHEQSWAVVLFRSLLFLTVAAVAAVLASGLLRMFRPKWRPPRYSRVALAIAPLLMIAWGVSTAPDLFSRPADPPARCVVAAGIDYCVHEGHASQLELLVDTLAPVFEAYGNKPHLLDRVSDRALADAEEDLTDHTYVIDIVPTSPLPGRDSHSDDRSRLADILAGVGVCLADQPRVRRHELGDTTSSFGIALELAGWLDTDQHTGETPTVFAGIPRERVQAWIAANQVRINSCALERDDLPR
ncbi:MAG: hypothetical protein ACRDQF_02240 [Thermocrispum sp.]